ncbi:imidazole glycerol phosphate synthase subunit HisH [Thiospirochaeta perfilievii]|uniref:Imidazole glycerol phosphate synthase subunit HisH n=1 Tax=Thiospirochaeta perfilievii TaxID=252967 RepID=A0A5C1Q9H9_9SPIO|nr:imidazole glycerol phosphate synthase subunit HisH [Thiospirochaeta perfilievii]QEN04008.1 imidazole glycerol phosphate synthase subunit HisH [Thiospirochaeta perfilievii]
MKIGIVDYNAGNLTSVVSALSFIGSDYVVSSEHSVLMGCDKLIFPGVGEANWAMEQLRVRDLERSLREFKKSGKPILGICLGSQIILDHSQESDTNCLGLVPGEAKHFPKDMGLKIPHIGWNTVEHNGKGIFRGIPKEASFYFVHSYYVEPKDKKNVIGKTTYGIEFCSSVEYENITAFQFHPEKSGEVGLQLLRNFVEA